MNRTAVLDALFEQWNSLDDVLSGLNSDDWYAPTSLPGWTVHDIAAHIIGTESLLAGIAPPHTSIDVRVLPHVHNEIGAFNEEWVEGLRGESGAALLERFREIVARRRSDLAAMSDEDFEAETTTPVGPAPYSRFMRIRVFDCWMHELDIDDALNRTRDETGLRSEVAFEELIALVGYAVGKKAKAPTGTRVVFALSGPMACRILVSVDERASVVSELPSPATVTIGMDARLFTRLAGGRTFARDHRSDITLDGDTVVGTSIVDNLAFTI
ncbi:maleylpyruvate isomerase family mycothiol-dependent enzyme [Rhodococcus sp. NPDC058521]|uniref:maleylpyruvate isomerase family mycothiol-dependent enzyme n=1 Tax=Rhodococcus sp. NPDC058521 TaxID=3346536 RepID=UPI003648B378